MAVPVLLCCYCWGPPLADDLRSDVATLNELRIAQEAQIQGLEASNRRLQEHVRVPRHRARTRGGRAQALTTPWSFT
jgi:hypothetical protein